ncbi:MAG: LysR family transcriptional regulator [Clostridiales bacterium]|nr:LysR family transcriptional regulator [Clostridiales bacterium]
MNYNKLNYFYTVAQTLNFSKAAEHLYISQSAVSRHMKELEADFGVTLFIRTNRDLILTDAGQVLYDEIRLFFSRENELYQKVRSAAQGRVPKLNIGFMGIRPAFHIPSIINEMILQIPDFSVNLKRYNWDDILPALDYKEIDIGLRLRMGEMQDSKYNHLVLDKDYPAMVVSERHPMAGKKHAMIEDFKNDNFLMLLKKDSAIPHTYTKRLMKNSGFSNHSYTEYDQVETILMLIHSDAGVSLLSRFAATDQFPDLNIIDLDGIDPLYLELVWRKNNDNPMIPLFAEHLKEDCSKKTD